jgi:uncharacterized protein YjbI with pentapeptide repeats
MDLSIRRWLCDRYVAVNHIKEMSSGQIAGIAYCIVQDMEAQGFMAFEICTLVEVLELPLSIVWDEISILTQLTAHLLRSLSQRKALKRNEGTWLAYQIAYLQALEQILHQESNLQRPWLDRAMIPVPPQVINEQTGKLTLKDGKLQSILKNFSPGKLTDTQAKQALSLVADSLLVQQINQAAGAWLVANGAEEPEAKLITNRLVNALPGHLLLVIANNAAPLAQLQKFVRLGNSLPLNIQSSEYSLSGSAYTSVVGDTIDLYREYYRASLLCHLSTPLFMESFALKDIYVPLTGFPVLENQPEETDDTPMPVDLMAWTQQQLGNLTTIAVIESESGYGKTTFCELWAAQVARELYPNWMPVLIHLRNITYGQTLAETLNSALAENLSIDLQSWLDQDYPRCLLILDGFDELPSGGKSQQAKRIFVQQLLNLLVEGRHKVLLTSRLNSVGEMTPELLANSKRIVIRPLEVDELRQWFQHWTKVQSLSTAQSFFTFSKQAGLFNIPSKLPELSTLIRQPLMLYILGLLHRDGFLDNKLLQLGANQELYSGAALRWEIHHRLSRCMLGYPHTEGFKTMLLRVGTAHIHRRPEAIANLLAGRQPQELLEDMQAIALQILHSDRHYIHLPHASAIPNLPSIYFRTSYHRSKESLSAKIEFSHLKLGEYICAQAIVNQLYELTRDFAKHPHDQDAEFTNSFAQKMYQLFGYGILHPELEGLIIAGLQKSHKQNFSFTSLFAILESFWREYCQGSWLNQGIAHQALTYFQNLKNPINVEQINAAVGFNVFILLCAINQVGDIPFAPCGNPTNLSEFNPTALIELINKTTVLQPNAFISRTQFLSFAGMNLSKACLRQVILSNLNLQATSFYDADLTDANLSGVNLERANLTGANLSGANLSHANLQRANLTGANLSNANLSNANLMGVNLNSVNLSQAYLFNTILDEADKEFAAQNGAVLSTKEVVTTTTTTDPTPEPEPSIQEYEDDSVITDAETQIWLVDSPDNMKIEMAEGVPLLPTDLYNTSGYVKS